MKGYHGAARKQVKEVTESLLSMEQLPFRDVLSSDHIERVLQEEGIDFRDRTFPP